MVLNVFEVNRRAYKLYRRLGFTEDRRFVEGPAVRIRMVAGVSHHEPRALFRRRRGGVRGGDHPGRGIDPDGVCERQHARRRTGE